MKSTSSTPKIAILSAPFGSGHHLAARALQAALSPEYVSQVIDPFQFLPARAGPRLVRAYLDLLHFAPQVWGVVYSTTEQSSAALLRTAVTRGLWVLVGKRLQAVLTTFAPDAIIAVHPFSAGLADAWVRATGWQGVFLVVTTDFAPHPFWLYPTVTCYCVATEAFVQACGTLGVPREKLRVTGIPLRSQFEHPPTREQARTALGIPAQTPMVLMMGGGLGLGRLAPLAEELMRLDPFVTVAVLAGKNHPLQRSLRQLAATVGRSVVHRAAGTDTGTNTDTNTAVDACVAGGNSPASSRLLVHGLVENVAAWMAASDVLVTKPGGLTVAEALAVGVPLILIDPLPGQEEANARYLSQAGVAQLVSHQDAPRLLSQLLAAPAATLQPWRDQARVLGQPRAARAVVQVLTQMLGDRPRSSITAPVAPAAEAAQPPAPAGELSAPSSSPPPAPAP